MQNNNENSNQIPPWLASALGIGGGLGTAAGGMSSLFGNTPNPADAANNRIGQIPGQVGQYYSPYMDAGKGALGDLQNQYKDLLGGDTQNKLGANFKESPGYQYNLQQAMQAGDRSAAAGGMLGGGTNQISNMNTASGLADQGYKDYMANQMNLYGQGLQGEQGLNQQGFDASKGMADTMGNVLSQQGAYDFMGQQGKNQQKSQGLSDLFTGLGTAGATAFGGPAGGAGFKALMGLFGGKGQGV
jgi:hypothetical protein